MTTEELKDIIVALINNNYFDKYSDNGAENSAKDVAKFINTFYEEIN